MPELYYFHIGHPHHGLSVDDEGTEFATEREASVYGAQVAKDIGEDDFDYKDSHVYVVDARGKEIARHRIVRQLQN